MTALIAGVLGLRPAGAATVSVPLPGDIAAGRPTSCEAANDPNWVWYDAIGERLVDSDEETEVRFHGTGPIDDISQQARLTCVIDLGDIRSITLFRVNFGIHAVQQLTDGVGPPSPPHCRVYGLQGFDLAVSDDGVSFTDIVTKHQRLDPVEVVSTDTGGRYIRLVMYACDGTGGAFSLSAFGPVMVGPTLVNLPEHATAATQIVDASTLPESLDPTPVEVPDTVLPSEPVDIIAPVDAGAQGDAIELEPPAIEPASASLSYSFPGASASSGGPPDPTSAVSGSYVLHAVNGALRYYNRSGTLQKSWSNSSFWGTSVRIFDPQTAYNKYSGRFALAADEDGKAIRLAVTLSGSPGGSWCQVRLPVPSDGNDFADFPRLATDSRNYYVTIFTLESTTDHTVANSFLFVVPRRTMESCGGGYSYYSNLRDPGTGGTFGSDKLAAVVVPVNDNSNLVPTGHFFNSYSSGGSHMTRRFMDGSTLYSQRFTTQSYSPPPPVPQPNTSARIWATDSRLTQAIMDRHGLIWTALTSKYDWGGGVVSSVVYWLQLDANARIVAQGKFGYRGDFFFMPTVVANSDRSAIAFAYHVSSKTVNPTFQISTAPYNSPSALTSRVIYRAAGPTTAVPTSNCSSCYRYGDFTSAVYDPASGSESFMWVTGEVTTSTSGYGTRIARVYN